MKVLGWVGYFLGWLVGVGLAGAAAGAVLFVLAGWILHFHYTTRELLLNGARIGAYLSLVWAPAVAIAASVMRAGRRRVKDEE